MHNKEVGGRAASGVGDSVDDVALGLTRGRKDQDLLQPWADDLGAITNKDWVSKGLSDQGPFVKRFYQALHRSTSKKGRIKFNLDDLDLNDTLKVNRFSDPFDVGVTNWELQQILGNRKFYDSTDFYIQKSKLSIEDVLGFGLGLKGK